MDTPRDAAEVRVLIAGLAEDAANCPEPFCGDHDLPIADAVTLAATTTPRDALAAALHAVPDETGMVASPDGAIEDADAILSALAAEGWVLVRKVQPCDWDCACNCHSVKAAPNPAPRIVAVHQCGDCGYTGDLAALTAHRCAPDPAPEWPNEELLKSTSWNTALGMLAEYLRKLRN